MDNIAVNDKNQLCYKDSHFYGSDSKLRPMVNHYLGLHQQPQVFRVSDFLFEKARICQGHGIMNAYEQSRGLKLFNYRSNSLVDEYDRLTIDNQSIREKNS